MASCFHTVLSVRKLDKDADGDVDFKDLKAVFAGGGGIVDEVKGMFN